MLATDPPIEGFFGDYRFLSNFYPAVMPTAYGTLSSSEHCYVFAKLGEPVERFHDISMMTPGEVKRFGRTLPQVDDWDDIKFAVMKQLIDIKFSEHNPELVDKLLSTGSSLLVEANNWGDTYWGQSPIGKGTNHLGRILMKRRDVLNDSN